MTKTMHARIMNKKRASDCYRMELGVAGFSRQALVLGPGNLSPEASTRNRIIIFIYDAIGYRVYLEVFGLAVHVPHTVPKLLGAEQPYQ